MLPHKARDGVARQGQMLVTLRARAALKSGRTCEFTQHVCQPSGPQNKDKSLATLSSKKRRKLLYFSHYVSYE